MKNTKFMVLALLLLGFVVTGCKKSEPAPAGDQAKQYTCPHHPEVVQDKPGKCPKCGMDLVEKK
jgi:hypothetical protein